MLGGRDAAVESLGVTGAKMAGHGEMVGGGGQSLPREWRAVVASRVDAPSDYQTAGETGAGTGMPASIDTPATSPYLSSNRTASGVTASREDARVGGASVRMLEFAVTAWHQRLAVERATRSGLPRPESARRAPECDRTTYDRYSIAIQASRVLIRETARMMGAHLRRTGVRPEHFVPMLRDAIHRASEDGVAAPEFTRLVRDVVTWGIEGYYACQPQESVSESFAGDVRARPARIPKRWP